MVEVDMYGKSLCLGAIVWRSPGLGHTSLRPHAPLLVTSLQVGLWGSSVKLLGSSEENGSVRTHEKGIKSSHYTTETKLDRVLVSEERIYRNTLNFFMLVSELLYVSI